MSIKDIDELSDEKYLQSRDVDARIADLSGASREDYMDEDSWECGQGELLALTEFRGMVKGQVMWSDGLTLIRDSEWDQYAVDTAGDIYGSLAVDSGFWMTEKFSDELMTDYQEAELNGTTFYFR